MKTAAIIQARMGSSRFPGKMMEDLNDVPVLERVVNRLKESIYLDNIIVATPDYSIAGFCNAIGVDSFVGSEHDVIQRVLDCAVEYEIGRIVDITGDCPLVDWRQVNKLCNKMDMYGFHYACNIYPRTWPDGFDIQVYLFPLLAEANRLLPVNSKHREHTGWNLLNFREQRKMFFSYYNLLAPEEYKFPHWGLTLDEEKDLELLKRIYDQFENDNFTAEQVIDSIKKDMDLLEINYHVKRKDPKNV